MTDLIMCLNNCLLSGAVLQKGGREENSMTIRLHDNVQLYCTAWLGRNTIKQPGHTATNKPV